MASLTEQYESMVARGHGDVPPPEYACADRKRIYTMRQLEALMEGETRYCPILERGGRCTLGKEFPSVFDAYLAAFPKENDEDAADELAEATERVVSVARKIDQRNSMYLGSDLEKELARAVALLDAARKAQETKS